MFHGLVAGFSGLRIGPPSLFLVILFTTVTGLFARTFFAAFLGVAFLTVGLPGAVFFATGFFTAEVFFVTGFLETIFLTPGFLVAACFFTGAGFPEAVFLTTAFFPVAFATCFFEIVFFGSAMTGISFLKAELFLLDAFYNDFVVPASTFLIFCRLQIRL